MLSSNCEKMVPCIPPPTPTIITTNQCPQPHDDDHLQNQMGCCSSGRVMIKKAAGGEEGDQLLLLQQQQQLKCPRCDSSNTKFCYYNNYSLSQPRHFCKACKRYWTRGGTLRNIPVGGGCRSRNNKRFIKTSITSTTDHHITTTSSSSTPTPHNNYNYLSQPSSLQLHNIIHTHPDLFYHGTASSLLSNNNNSFLPISSFNNSSSGVYNDLMKASTRLGFAASTDEINGFSSILRSSSSSTCDHSSSICKPVMIMPNNNLVQHNHGLKNGGGSTTDDHHGSIFQGLNTIEQMQTAIISNGNGMMKGNQVQEQENRSLDLDDQCINVGLMFDHPTTNSFNYWNTASAAMGVWSSSTHHQTT